jgi:hypothetical protein
MPAQSNLMMNPMLGSLSPADQQSLVQLQQRQAIGQAMLQEGMQPMDTSNAQVGGLAYHVSPLQGMAKLLQTYLGNKMSMDSAGQQAQLMGQMYGNAFGTNQAPAQPAPAQQAAPTDAGGMTSDQSGPGVVSSPVATPGAAQLGQAMGGGAAPAQAAAPVQMSNGALTLPGKTPQQSMMLYSMLGPEGYARVLSQWGAPTDATRMAMQAGQDPRAANAGALFKANYVPPITGTGTFRDPHTMQPVAFNPDIPAGTTPLYDASGNVAAVNPIAGAQSAMQGNAAATAAGGAQFKPVQVYNPTTHQMEYSNESAVTNPPSAGVPRALTNGMPPTQDGTPNGAPMTPLQRSVMNTESFGSPNAVSPKGAVGSMQTMPATLQNPGFGVKPPQNSSPAELQRVGVDFLGAMQKRYGNDSDAVVAYNMGPAATDKWVAGGRQWNQLPAETQNYVGKTLAQAQNYQGSSGGTAPSGAPAAAPPLGVPAGASTNATDLQNEMSKKWTDLNAANQQAQSTVSYLQNIKTLAPAAATGPQADRLNYANGLLSLAGSAKATDAVTATDLLNKYSNQITARLSANGMGTDSARTILQSAYPNAHMTPQAISEAADNLIGAQQMTQAKTKLLAPLRNAGDAQGYTNTEMQFDQNADPRIFQYANIQDPVARAAFAKNLMQQDPKIVTKIQSLQKLGAMQ